MGRPKPAMLFGAAFALASAGAGFAQPLDERREKILSFDMKVELLPAARPVTPAGLDVPTAPAPVNVIAVRMRLSAAGTPGWTVVVEGSQGEVERVTAPDFVNGEYWTKDVPGGQARLSLAGAADVRIDVVAYAVPVTQDVPQAIVGTDDSRFISDPVVPPRVQPWARSVARLRFMTASGRGVCTGFLVGGDLLLTNQHCISDAAEAASAQVEFGFDSAAATPATFGVTRIEAVDARLDYSLLRLSGNAAARFGRLFAGPAAAAQMELVLLQHPQGLPKKVAFPPNCSVGSTAVAGVDDAVNDFGHVCDTLRGSSGSPVLHSETGAIVGLHHWRWPAGAAIPENQAVHWGLIVRDLAARVKAGTLAKGVLDEVTRRPPQ
jgi:hypothetical protein